MQSGFSAAPGPLPGADRREDRFHGGAEAREEEVLLEARSGAAQAVRARGRGDDQGSGGAFGSGRPARARPQRSYRGGGGGRATARGARGGGSGALAAPGR